MPPIEESGYDPNILFQKFREIEPQFYKPFIEFLLQQGFLQKNVFEAFLQSLEISKQLTPEEVFQNQEYTKEEATRALNFSKTDSSLLFTPDSLQNRYQVLETLGEGGMGIVQRVQDCLLGREVALKKMKIAVGSTQFSPRQKMMIWRFQREAEITATLEHPNIIPLYDMQEKKGELEFTMRKIEGDTLKSLLKKIFEKKQEPDENMLLSIFLKVCDAVSYAHSKEIVHRDLKPENIMVGQFGEVYVMDWGIAKKLNQHKDLLSDPLNISTSYSSSVEEETFSQLEVVSSPVEENSFRTIGGLGTPSYMPPEQQKDAASVTPQSDIYALGKILRGCFTWMSPWEEFQFLMRHSQKEEGKKKHINELNEAEKELNRKIPRDIQAIIVKATAEKPENRYRCVQDLAKDIKNYSQHFRVSAKEYGLIELFKMWLRRYQKNLMQLSGSFLVVILVVAYVQQQRYSKIVQKDQERLRYWLQVLQDPSEGLKQRALLEINKMRSPQIARQLISLLQEGTSYYLNETKRNARQDEYYKTIVEMIGWLENPNNSAPLFDSFEKMAIHILNTEKKKQRIADEIYLVVLVEAMAYSKGTELSLKIHEIRWCFGENSSFWKSTELAFSELLKIDGGLETLVDLNCSDTSEYIRRALIRLLFKDLDGAFRDCHSALKRDPNFALAYQILGIIQQRNGDFQKALQDYNRAIELNPNLSDLYNNRGITKEVTKDFEGAIQDYNKAIELNPYYVEAYNNRGVARKERGDLDGAILDYNKAIELDPQFVEAYNNRGLAKRAKGDLLGAIQDYTRAIQIHPGYFKAYNNRGIAKRISRDLVGALEDFDYLIANNAQFAEAYNSRGLVKKEKGDLLGAIQDYNRAIEINTKFAEAYNNRGVAKKSLGDFEGAISDYQQACQWKKDYKEAIINQGLCEYSRHRFQESLKFLEQAIEIDPRYAEAYMVRGNVKKKLGDIQGASFDYNKAIELDPQYAEAYNNRGILKKELKQFKEALADFDQAIALNPYSVNAYNNRGISRKIVKDFKGALKDYEKVIELDPQSDSAYLFCAQIRKELGDIEGALLDYEKAISINPKYGEAYTNRGNIKRDLGRFQEAIQDYNQAIASEPELVLPYFNRGIVKAKLGDFDGSILDFTLAIERDKTQSLAYLNRAIAYLEKEKKIEALSDLEQAILLNNALLKQRLIANHFSDLLLEQSKIAYQEKKFSATKEFLLKFKKYFTQHPQLEQVQKMLQKIETLLAEENKDD